MARTGTFIGTAIFAPHERSSHMANMTAGFIAGVSPYPFAGAILAILMFNWRLSGRVGRVTALGSSALSRPIL